MPSTRGLAPLLRASWEALGQRRAPAYRFIALFIVANVVELLVPWTIGYTIGVFVEHGLGPGAFQGALVGIAAYLGIRLVNILLHHLGRYVQCGVAFRARMSTMSRVFGALLAYGLPWHVDRHTGEKLAKLNRSAGAVHGPWAWMHS